MRICRIIGMGKPRGLKSAARSLGVMAWASLKMNQLGRAKMFLTATLLLAVLFLVLKISLEYVPHWSDGYTMRTNNFWGLYYTMTGLHGLHILGGIVVIETVFSYQGLGRLLIFAIERHDLPLIQAAILIVAAIYCVSNLIADLLYAYLNPKIRYGSAGY